MIRPASAFALTLVILVSRGYSDETNLSGVWKLSSLTVYEKGQESSGIPQLFNGEKQLHVHLTQSQNGYEAVAVSVGGTRSTFKSQLTIEKYHGRFKGTWTDGKKTIAVLLDVKPTELQATCSPLTPKEIPSGFGPPVDTNQVKLDAIFQRLKTAEAVVWVHAPKGAIISVGEWSNVVQESPLGIRTESLPTDRETPFDVELALSIDGRNVNDRIRVWATGGSETVADFFDVKATDAAARTHRYWVCCCKTLHGKLKEAGRAKSDEERPLILAEMARQIRSTPSRGVDKQVVEKWLAFVTATNAAIEHRQFKDAADFLFESALRGAAGDPFGAVIDRQKQFKVDATEVYFTRIAMAHSERSGI